MKYLRACRSLDARGWLLVAAMLVGPPVVLLVLLVSLMLAGPLVTALVAICIVSNVVAMRRYYRERRARHGA
jgi:hypothetical protein